MENAQANNQAERLSEEKRLEETLALATKQLTLARAAAEKKKTEILEAKREVYENTEHAIPNLWSADGFEALAELSQYTNPVTEKIADYEEEERRIPVWLLRYRADRHCKHGDSHTRRISSSQSEGGLLRFLRRFSGCAGR